MLFPRKAERVIVAVKAEKIISNVALLWALTHAARPGDCITLLAVVYDSHKIGGRRFWELPRLKVDVDPNKWPDRVRQVSESCSQMLLQVQDQIQVQVQIKVVSPKSAGAVTAEAKSHAANWIVLDK